MRLEPPVWWYGSRPIDRLKAAVLAPAAWAYGAAADARFALATPYRSRLPVICIGNFTAGGAGKTPLALEVARMCHELGHRPVFLTRGYGGSIQGPHMVRPGKDRAADVGDEALLLARAAPTCVARNRCAGAKAIEANGADLIVMDDGFQNPSLAKDLALVAIDAATGLGNGRVLPAGPLRAPLASQLSRTTAIVCIGDGDGAAASSPFPQSVPRLQARIAPTGDASWLRTAPVLAFCGIGRPSKFFRTLEVLGADLAAAIPFPDHHNYTEQEARNLISRAVELGAALVTTEKDWVRIDAAQSELSELKAKSRVLPITLQFTDADRAALADLLRQALHSAAPQASCA